VREVLAPFIKTSPTKPTKPAQPTLTVKAHSPQRLLTRRYVGVAVTCSQTCTVSATGVITILHTRISFPLQRATARLHATGSVHLRLGLSRALRQKLKPHLQRGQHCRATIVVKARFQAGQRRTATRRVTVR